MDNRLIFETSKRGRRCTHIPSCDVPLYEFPSDITRENNADLPEVAEVDLVRHYTNLSKKAYGVDNGFYPLGSCTMKYNPKVSEDIALIPGFAKAHPLQPSHTAQGCLELMVKLSENLCEITGMDAYSLQPAAGAQGEFLGLGIIKSYLEYKGETTRTKVIVPDSSHGTNPASAAMCGFTVITVPSKSNGLVDVEKLKTVVGKDTAALMLTNPSTAGLFERDIIEISDIVHQAGGLLYFDGANMNAIMGITRPGDMGFDVVHLNLHKTFAAPHGGGGPGSGPVGCKKFLAEFLPGPIPVEKDGIYNWEWQEKSVGKIGGFYGNFAVYLKAYAYILLLGAEGLREASEYAVLNANYLLNRLKSAYPAPYGNSCMHEFVLSLADLKKDTGVSALDIAKNLIDNGIHPPTMYFPLIVSEALMFEPTETESKETLDHVANILLDLHGAAYENAAQLQKAPVTTPVRRVDEVKAARNPVVIAENTLQQS